MGNKRGNIVTDNLGWIIIGVVVLVLVVTGIIILTGKGEGVLEFARDLFRFRG